MQAELDVHESVTRVATGSVPAEWNSSPSGNAEELGDNVEFF